MATNGLPTIDYGTLSAMNPADAQAYLQSLYGGGIGPRLSFTNRDEYTGQEMTDYGYGGGDGGTHLAYRRGGMPEGLMEMSLTNIYDPSYEGGQYGSWRGDFDEQGNLVGDPRFQQAERSGSWMMEHPYMAPLAVLGAGLGGSALGLGGAGGGGGIAGATGAETLAGGAAADTLGGGIGGGALGTGLTAGTTSGGIGGGALGTGITPTLGGIGGSLSAGQLAGGAGAIGGASSLMDTLGGLARTAAPIAGAIGSYLDANNQPENLTSTRDVPERFQPYGNDLMQRAQQVSNLPQTNPYQTNPNVTDAISATRGAMDNFGGATAGARQFLGEVQSGQRDYTPGTIQEASNPYIGQTSQGASNPYIGQTTPGITGPRSVMGLAQQAQVNNPYIGQSAGQAQISTANQAGKNPLLGMNNPYLNNAINLASQDAIQQYQTGVAPQRAAEMQASGSFGNATVNQMAGIDQQNLARTLGNISSGMRMQDYGMQAQLGEGQAGREQGVNLANAGFQNQGSQFNTAVRGQDLGRNLAGYQAQGQFNAGNLLNAGMFDVGQEQGAKQFNATLGSNELGRNAGLAGQQGQFNATLGQNDLSRNANLTQGLSQFNSGVGAANIANQQQAWTGNNNLAMNSINPTLNIANNPITQAQALYGMGSGQQAFDASGVNWQNQAPWQNLQNYGGIYGTVAQGGTQTMPNSTPNPWASALGTGLGIYGMLNQPTMPNYGGNYWY